MLCVAEVDRECIYIFQSCERRRQVEGQGLPTPIIAVSRNPMPQVWTRGSGSQWGTAVKAQHFRGKLRGRWEEWRECDKAGGGFSKGRGRNKQGKEDGVGKPGVPFSTVSHTGGRFGSLSWKNRELLYWGVPLLLLWMNQISWAVSPQPLPTADTGDSMLPAATHLGHQQPQKQQTFVVIVLVFIDDLAQVKMKISGNL